MIRYSERLLILMAGIGFILKGFYFEPAGGFLMGFALIGLSLVYALLGWRLFRIELSRAEKRPNVFYGKIAAFVLAFSILAFLVKIFTPPSSNLLAQGWFLLIIANSTMLVLFIIFKAIKLDYVSHRYLKLRMTVVFLICTITMFISSHSIIRFFYRYDPVLAQHYINAFDYPENQQFRLQFKQYRFDEAQKKIQQQLKEAKEKRKMIN